MDKQRVLIDMNEASSVIMNFIGTDRFNSAISAVENNARAGFTAGISFAFCLMMAECNKYLYLDKEGATDE